MQGSQLIAGKIGTVLSVKKSTTHHLNREKLSVVGIPIKNIAREVYFDTEQACELKHDGRWQEHLG